VDGSLSAFDQNNGLWLTAGQGVLLALGNRAANLFGGEIAVKVG
jgi:hypothetical protein